MAGGRMPMSLTEIVQQLLDHIKNHPLDWNASDHMDRYRSCWVLALGRVY